MLDPLLVSYYRYQIGVLIWMFELGRVDINTEFLMLASCLVLPREVHLEVPLRVYVYLHEKHNTRLTMDPYYPGIDNIQLLKFNLKEFYGNVKEAVSPDAPEPRGKESDLRVYVNIYHAEDKDTCISRTGFIIYMNKASILCLSNN